MDSLKSAYEGVTVRKPIPGFDGYEIDEQGQVWSQWVRRGLGPGYGTRSEIARDEAAHQMAMIPARGGYSKVNLRRVSGGVQRNLLVHRLVLEVFVGPCPDGMEACHDNGVRTDNRLSNLRWDTRANNHADKKRHGTSQGGERHNMAKLTWKKVGEIRKKLAEGASLCSLGREYGVSEGAISDIKKGRTWAYVGESN